MSNFETLRSLVQAAMPQQLEAFDQLAIRLRRFQHDDDVLLFIEAAGFVALLSHQVPQAILESNKLYGQSLETLKQTLERVAQERDVLQRAQDLGQKTARDLESTLTRIKVAALEIVTKLDTKALSEKLSVALVQTIDQSVEARTEITANTKALQDVGQQYRNEVRQFNKLRIGWMVALGWLSAFLLLGSLYFFTWQAHRQWLDDEARRRLAASLLVARELQDHGIELKVTHDHDTFYLITPEASKAYISENGEGVIAIQAP